MCGIVAYIGSRPAYPMIVDGLRRLEYRGYDSAGVCVADRPGEYSLFKCRGAVDELVAHVGETELIGTIGVGHTRWATHGVPSDINAHPHVSMYDRVVMVHNGIIENYLELRRRLEQQGYEFRSETDTEVFVNLIEYIMLRGEVSLETALRLSLRKVVGAYGVCLFDTQDPDTLYVARLGSPLVIGVGKGEYFVASDATPIVSYTPSVVILNDGDVAVLRRDALEITNGSNQEVVPEVKTIDWSVEDSELGNFEHYMLKEIFEQPRSVGDTFRGRISADRDFVTLGGLYHVLPRLVSARRIIIVGCGTSWHAGLLGEYLIEDLARLPVEVEYASEFRYRNPILDSRDIVLAISQSGETADTLAAVRLAKERGSLVLGICNVVGSTISRETDAGVYTHAGPEIGVASTKAFSAQVTVLTLLAMLLGNRRGVLSSDRYRALITEMLTLPEKIERVLGFHGVIREVAEHLHSYSNCLYLGRGFNYPVALEGALKLKEISYIHAEGYPAAEMKHGPIALIDEQMPVVVIATRDAGYEKVFSNIQEVKARNGWVIAIVTEGDEAIRRIADYCIEIPAASPPVEALLSVVPLQILAYHAAVMRGCNVDRPRNLAKSVTVE